MNRLRAESIPAVVGGPGPDRAPGWWGTFFSFAAAIAAWAGILAIQGQADYLIILFVIIPYKLVVETLIETITMFTGHQDWMYNSSLFGSVVHILPLTLVVAGIGVVYRVIRWRRWRWSVVRKRELARFLILILMSGTAHLTYAAANSTFVNDCQTRWQVMGQEWGTLGVLVPATCLLDAALFIILTARVIYLLAVLGRKNQPLTRGEQMRFGGIAGLLMLFMVVGFPGTTDRWFINRHVDFPLPASATLVGQGWVDVGNINLEPRTSYGGRFTVSAADMEMLLAAPPWWATGTDVEHDGDEDVSPPTGWQRMPLAGQIQAWITDLEHNGVTWEIAPSVDQSYLILAREKRRAGLGWSWRRLLVADPPTRTIWYYSYFEAAW